MEVSASPIGESSVPGLRICAIGASAGGLAPVESFFEAMPPDSGMAFVVVQHLSPDHESMMVQLLTSHTEMPVQQAIDNTVLEANNVYLIPPGGELTVHEGRLRLRKRTSDRRHLHRPIDVFFVSMAREYTTRSVAVILSGTGSDGTAGIEQVARAGGLALVQDNSAAFEGMPDAAVRSGFVDAVLSPAELAAAVSEFATSAAKPAMPLDEVGLQPVEARIMADLEELSGINFSEYKPGTLHRRLNRRVGMSDMEIDAYAEHVRADATERLDLIQDLLIDVTKFFRDAEFYDQLQATVLPRLVTDASDRDMPIRVWSAGCATGEEPYSLAMAILETSQALGVELPAIQIFATDVHKAAIDEASAGKYSDERMGGVSYSRRAAFFERTEGGWIVKPEVRNLITFAEHNLLADAPFTRLDLAICRNLLIYFRRAAQDRAIGAMSFALRIGGVLALGPSESLGLVEPDFTTIDSAWRIWEKTSETARSAYRPTLSPLPRSAAAKRGAGFGEQKILRAYDVVLDSQFAGGLLISESRELVHSMGGASAWLRQPSGRPTLDVVSMVADENLRLSIMSALRELEQGAIESRDRQIVVPANEAKTPELVMLRGRRLRVGNDQLFLLYTHPIARPVQASTPAEPPIVADAQSNYVAQLEAELLYAREGLQSAIEVQETSSEELNAANEELIASNEELQSTNEELSSVNEELRTLNEEHRRQLEQVLDLSADLEQLMSSTDIGVVFLAEDRSIRRFNEPARDYFRVRESDIGRPFEDVMTLLDASDLDADIESAFSSGEGHTRHAKLRDEATRHLLIQVDRYELPRRRWGVFVAVVDISNAMVADQEKMLATYLRSAPVSVKIWDPENVCVYANQLTALETGSEVAAGQTPSDLFVAELAETVTRENAEVAAGGPLTALRSIGSAEDAAEFVVSKFPIEIDDRIHVGTLAIPAAHVETLSDLRDDSATLKALVENGVAQTWKIDSRAAVTAGKSALQPTAQASTAAAGDEAVHAATFDRLAAAVRRAIPGVDAPVVRLDDPDGTESRWVEVRDLVLDDERTLVAAVDVDRHKNRNVDLVDVTGRLKMELAETRASGAKRSADLAERNLDLDNFAHVAAHDLKAPIRSVRSFSEMALGEVPLDSAASEYIGQVIEASRRMGDLVESLLDFASIDREPTRTDTIDLDSVIEDLQIDLRSSIEASEAEVVVIDELPSIEGSTEAMRQVMANLLNNAIKYRSDKRPRVEISSTADEDGVTIVVADNGLGFDPDQAERMFEPFQRLHPTSVSGSGVGLAICRRIVQRHHGRIWATSELGVGSRFSVWLPTQAPQPADSADDVPQR